MSSLRETCHTRPWAIPRELINHIVAVHHGYVRLSLKHLDRLIARIAREHIVPLGLMDRLAREFTALAEVLETHMARQECWLFPKICGLREPVGETAWAFRSGDSLEEAIGRTTRERQEVLGLARQIQAYLSDPRWVGKGPLVDELIEGMQELHEDLTAHFHLETDVLFPHVCEALRAHQLAV